jgi:hypothetical protein
MDKCSESAAAVVPVVPSLRSLCGAMNRVLGSCSLGATYIAVPIKIERGAVGEYWGCGVGGGVEREELRWQANKAGALTDNNALLSDMLVHFNLTAFIPS